MAVDNNQIVVGAFVGIVAFVVAWAAALVVSFLNNIFCIISCDSYVRSKNIKTVNRTYELVEQELVAEQLCLLLQHQQRP